MSVGLVSVVPITNLRVWRRGVRTTYCAKDAVIRSSRLLCGAGLEISLEAVILKKTF